MIEIVNHPNYDGIPGGLDAEGRVDWTIPSNRKEGSKNWDGNARRRDWWRRKATSFDVPLVGQWLSRTARLNHPFQEKPCQICGRVMSIRYAYPSAHGQYAFQSAFPAVDFDWSAIETVFEALLMLKSEVGEAAALEGIAGVFTRQGEDRPGDWTALMTRVDGYVDGASRLLSPGAMSNCPDRLDGFHTYNLCCRRNQDKGRGSENMARYVVDRRAYELWAEGEWDVADLVMQAAGEGICANGPNCRSGGGVVQLSADHIGPISLGFKHSPFFSPLCSKCNSGKNNRMDHQDVMALRRLEARGVEVVSWQARYLWNSCKSEVDSDGKALLLSRLLRINQDAYLRYLGAGATSEHPEALLQFLGLHLAAQRIVGLIVDPQTLVVGGYGRQDRQGTYVAKRVERVVRVAFEALGEYLVGERSIHGVDDSLLVGAVATYEAELKRCVTPPGAIGELVPALQSLVTHGHTDLLAPAIAASWEILVAEDWEAYGKVRRALDAVMQGVQEQLVHRFVRGDHRRPGWSTP
jgi:Alw26I/Eco31I/Esp3I family type II restriction endonuclease